MGTIVMCRMLFKLHRACSLAQVKLQAKLFQTGPFRLSCRVPEAFLRSQAAFFEFMPIQGVAEEPLAHPVAILCECRDSPTIKRRTHAVSHESQRTNQPHIKVSGKIS